MSLRAMIQSHDESALETLSSKGLLRRAQRTLADKPGRIEALENDAATVHVEGCEVTLRAKGPEASSCTCKAHGVCRHILHAVLLLRREGFDSDPAPTSKADNAPSPTVPRDADRTDNAVAQIGALSDAQIVKFAGADWPKAAQLAADALQVSYADEDINITLRFEELDAVITFIAGKGLRGAAYKGPKTKKRLLITVAALTLRQRKGQSVDQTASMSSSASAATPDVSEAFVEHAKTTIERAVSAVLPSRSILARDLLLDLAISTRCEALPRLSAELRALATQAERAYERSVEFAPAAFLLDAARAYALLEVLSRDAQDPLLVGTVRRDYAPGEAREVWPLGVARWRSNTGARGLTAYVFDPANARWLSSSVGRSAGADASFDVRRAYDAAVWGAGSLSGLMGRRVHLPKPSIAADGSMTSKTQPGSKILEAPLRFKDVVASAAAHRNWRELRAQLAVRMGVGLRRRAAPMPALIVPTDFGRIGFDDLRQAYRFAVHDEAGDPLVLTVPADEAANTRWNVSLGAGAGQDDVALQLWSRVKKTSALLVEASLREQSLEFRPVSVLAHNDGRVSVHNMDFDDWPAESGLERVVSKVKKRVAMPLALDQRGDAVAGLADEVAEELVGVVCKERTQRGPSVVRRVEACGLSTLKRTLALALEQPSVPRALRAAYVAGELKRLSTYG